MRAVAFLGLGVMGGGMAARLVDAGWTVAVWNRRRDRADPLVARGARLAASPRDAASRADFVVSMVADDDVSRAIWLGAEGALEGAKRDTVLIESSTVSPAWIHELAAMAASRGCPLLDAPVTGSRTQAAGGQLLFLVGGDPDVLGRVRPLLQDMSREIRHVGRSGSGAMLKLVNNFVCGVQGAALAEAVAMIERTGLDVQQALRVLVEGAPGSPLVKSVATRMTTPDYSVHFALSLMRKDVTYAMAAAESLGLSLKTAAAARERFSEAIDAGWGDKDFSSVVEPLRR